MSFYNVINQASMQGGQPEDIGPVLANFNALAGVINGGLDNQNIAANANIDPTKLNLPTDVTHGAVPIGGMIDYAGAGDPAGGYFLLADGREISRSTYTALYAALGGAASPYGQGDGATTFNIPDFRGRVAVGPDNMGTGKGAASRMATSNGLGNSAGEETHKLLAAEMPVHNHGGATAGGVSGNDSPDHAHSGSTGGQSADHSHGIQASYNNPADNTHTGSGYVMTGFGFNHVQTYPVDGSTLGTSNDHSHGFTSGGASARHTHTIPALTISNAGGDGFHNNMPPYQVVNKLIRVL